MAADPQLEAQSPPQGVGGPQEPSPEPSEAYLDQYGHPSPEYAAGCMLAAAVLCKDSLAAQEHAADPEAAQKLGSGAFAFAQAYEKIAGKSSPEPDPVKLAQLQEKARQSDVKQNLTAAKQADDVAHKDQQASQDAAKAVLEHQQREREAEQRASAVRNRPDNKSSG